MEGAPVKEVNADHIEQWTKDLVAKLGAEGELLDAAIAAANTADEDRTAPLRLEQTALLSASTRCAPSPMVAPASKQSARS